MRIRGIAETVFGICEQYKDDHDLFVYAEAMPFSTRPNGKTYTRTELFGLVKYLLFKAGIPCCTVTTTTLKKQFAKNGTATKDNMIAAVYNRYNRVIKNDNIADAIGLASIGNRHIVKKANFPHILCK